MNDVFQNILALRKNRQGNLVFPNPEKLDKDSVILRLSLGAQWTNRVSPI